MVRVTNRIEAAPARRFADETFLVMVHGTMCWLVGRRIPLTRAEFGYPRPPYAQEYAVMYSQHLRFDAGCTAVRFDAAQLRAPVIQDEASLKTFLRTAPQSVFLKYKNEESFTARLRRRLAGASAGEGGPAWRRWPGSSAWRPPRSAAGSTRRGRATRASRTSCAATRPSTTCARAGSALRRSAALLGFQETSAFHRAFKRWSGVQPGEYRRRQAALGPP